MKADVAALSLSAPASDIALLRLAEIDLRQAGGLGDTGKVSYTESSTLPTVEAAVTLA